MKKAVLCMVLTCSAMSNAMADTCSETTIGQLKDHLSQKKEMVFKNPFLGNCVNLVTKKVEKTQFNQQDFDGRKDLFDEYLRFSQSSEAGVQSFYDKSKGKLYQFFNYNTDDIMFKSMKERWSKRDSVSVHFDDFLKLHEIAHLDHSVIDGHAERKNIDKTDPININHSESVADVSSVIMLSIENDLTIDQMMTLLADVESLRKRDAKMGYRSSAGDIVKDDLHYDRKIFAQVKSLFDDIDNKEMKVSEYFKSKNIPMEKIPSMISLGEFS